MTVEGAPAQPADHTAHDHTAHDHTAHDHTAHDHTAHDAESLSDLDWADLLTVTVQHSDDAVSLIRVAGELDMLTGPALRDHLDRLLAARPERLIVDLSHVSFIGLTGLSILVGTRYAAGEQGTALQLKGTSSRAVARLLDITGLNYLFDIISPDIQP